ncbi:SGNH hydrolase domain-containing protein [Novosphingobium colocasiae]
MIIAGRWSNLYGLPARKGTFDPTARFLMDADHRARNVRSSLDVMARSLDRMAGQLLDRGVAVTMLREPPRYAANVRDCVALALWRGQSVVSRCGMPEAEARAMREPVDAVFFASSPALQQPADLRSDHPTVPGGLLSRLQE